MTARSAQFEIVNLGDIAKVVSGYAFKSKDFGEVGVPVIKIKNIRVGHVDLSDVAYIDPSFLSLPDKYHVKGGDLLISLTGSHLTQPNSVVGRVALHSLALGSCLLNQRAGKIILKNPELCDSRYLFYSLYTWEKRQEIAQMAAGAASQANVSPLQVESVRLRLPPIKTQRKIASILSTYDDLIENNTRRIKILEEMAQTIYHEWFVNFRFPGHEKVKMVDSPLGKIPEGWEVKPLSALIESHIGGGWGKEEEEEKHTEPAWVIRGTDIPGARHCQLSNIPYRYHASSNLKSRKLSHGEIIFEVSGGSKGQPVGRTLLLTKQLLSSFGGEAVICASFCKRVVPKSDGLQPEHLYLSFVEGYESGEIEQYQVQSTGISNFKWKEYIQQVNRVVPSEKVSIRFLEIIRPIFSQVAMLGLKNSNLRQARDLLLPKLISGNIDVSELEIEVKEAAA